MTADQLAALHDIVTILRRMLSGLDRNAGRIEVLRALAEVVDVADVLDTAESWEKYTLQAIGNVGLSISAVADGDEERLHLVTSLLGEWEDMPGDG